MKKYFVYLFILTLFSACSPKESENMKEKQEHIVLAYVTSWTDIMPDPSHLTHINYAFGHVNETYNGVRIDNEDRLRAIVDLKKQKPSLKILLSIGGWGSGGFSEMAAVRTLREAFAADCKRVVDEFELDGIDLDWEYPTHTWHPNVASSPEDYGNYTLLCIDIRKAIGPDVLFTMATLADADPIIDYETLVNYKDFFNIMTYDLAMLRPTDPPGHQGGLFRSDKTLRISCEEAVNNHVAAGIPINKLVLGILFGGRGQRVPNPLPEGYTHQWDDVAKASYITNAEGEFIRSFECLRAIEHKCEFVKERGMLGAMYWSYSNPEFSQAVYDGLIDTE
jgi:chitinase